jgi:nitrogen-specific signal transduction histidine kinase
LQGEQLKEYQMKEEVAPLDSCKDILKFTHDANNCLTAILGDAELILLLMQIDAKCEEVDVYVRDILGEANTLKELIHELDEQHRKELTLNIFEESNHVKELSQNPALD